MRVGFRLIEELKESDPKGALARLYRWNSEANEGYGAFEPESPETPIRAMDRLRGGFYAQAGSYGSGDLDDGGETITIRGVEAPTETTPCTGT